MIEPPYITAWTGELGYVVRPAPILRGTMALFARTGWRGRGVPIWGKISEERQRECALRRLCQVCHRPIRLTDVGYSLVPLKVLRWAGSSHGATHEPLTCSTCLPKVLRSCPAIRRMAADEHKDPLVALAVRRYGIAVQMIGPLYPPPDAASTDINGALAEAGCTAAASFAELVMEDFDEMAPAKLFERAGLVPP